MSGIFGLLNAANRIFEEPAVYLRSGTRIPLKVAVESEDRTSWAGEVPQTFRAVTVTLDADRLTIDDVRFRPKRDDRIVTGSHEYKVVQRDGITWRERFPGRSDRIMVFCEKVPENAPN